MVMKTRCQVTEVNSHAMADELGPLWTFEVSRVPENVMFAGVPLTSADVPDDVREALLSWLTKTK